MVITIIIIIISLVIIGYLIHKLHQRQIIDKTEMTTYQNDLIILVMNSINLTNVKKTYKPH